VLENYF